MTDCSFKSATQSLIFLPIIGVLFVLIATYGSGHLNGFTMTQMHNRDISVLGYKRANEFWWLFTASFIIASLFIICLSLLKYWIMNNISQTYSHSTVLSFILGAIGIIMMALIPLTYSLHIICALIGMICLIHGQVADTLHWRQYRINNTQTLKCYDHCLVAYGLISPSLSFCFFLFWALSTSSAMQDDDWNFLIFSHPHLEWIGFWLLISGFFIQSIHAIIIQANTSNRSSRIRSHSSPLFCSA